MNIQTALVKNGWHNQSLALGQVAINFLLHTTLNVKSVEARNDYLHNVINF